MSESYNKNRPTPVLVTAANILQELSPSRLGLLLVIYDNDTQTQKEISDIIGRTQSTISTYLQSLGSLTPPLAARQGKYYTVTQTGEKVVGLVNDLARRCGHKLRSFSWADETDRKTVEAFLTPLHDSQIMRPYFILDSLSNRCGVDGPIGTPQPVRFDDVVRDVEKRQDDIGKSSTTEEIRRTVKLRFHDTDTVRFESGEILLENKGHQQVCLWDGLLQYLETRDEIDSSEVEETTITATETITEDLSDFIATPSISGDSSSRTNDPNSVLQRISSERSLGDRPSVTGREGDSEQATITPVYTLRSINEVDREQSDSSPILPLTATMTIEELITSASQLANKYGEQTELVLDWMVQTESGFYPLTSGNSSISDALELQNE